jgi:hypothetical protein
MRALDVRPLQKTSTSLKTIARRRNPPSTIVEPTLIEHPNTLRMTNCADYLYGVWSPARRRQLIGAAQ